MEENSYVDFGIDYEVLDEFLCEFVLDVTYKALNVLSRKQCNQFMEWFDDEMDAVYFISLAYFLAY